MLEFFFIFMFQRVNIKMEDGSKTPGGMSTVSGPGGGGPNPAIKQPMIYICGECHAGMVTKAFLLNFQAENFQGGFTTAVFLKNPHSV